MAQFVELPNGDSIEFPDDMSADAMSAAITQSFPEFAPKAEPPSLFGRAKDAVLGMAESMQAETNANLESKGSADSVAQSQIQYQPGTSATLDSLVAPAMPVTESDRSELLNKYGFAGAGQVQRKVDDYNKAEEDSRIARGQMPSLKVPESNDGIAEGARALATSRPITSLGKQGATLFRLAGQYVAGEAIGNPELQEFGRNVDLAGKHLFDKYSNKERRDAPQYDSMMARGVYSGLSSLEDMAIAIMMAGPKGALGYMTAGQVGLPAIGEAMDKGIGASGSAAYGAGQAAIEYVTEKLPMGYILDKFGKEGVKKFVTGYMARELPGELLATASQNALEQAVLHPEKTWAQYRAELPAQLGETAIAVGTMGAVMGSANAGYRGMQDYMANAAADRAKQSAMGAWQGGIGGMRPKPSLAPDSVADIKQARADAALTAIPQAENIDQAIAAAEVAIDLPMAQGFPDIEDIEGQPFTLPQWTAQQQTSISAPAMQSTPLDLPKGLLDDTARPQAELDQVGNQATGIDAGRSLGDAGIPRSGLDVAGAGIGVAGGISPGSAAAVPAGVADSGPSVIPSVIPSVEQSQGEAGQLSQQAGAPVTPFKKGDTVRFGDDQKVDTVESVGPDGWVYAASGASGPANIVSFAEKPKSETGSWGGLAASDPSPSHAENEARWRGQSPSAGEVSRAQMAEQANAGMERVTKSDGHIGFIAATPESPVVQELVSRKDGKIGIADVGKAIDGETGNRFTRSLTNDTPENRQRLIAELGVKVGAGGTAQASGNIATPIATPAQQPAHVPGRVPPALTPIKGGKLELVGFDEAEVRGAVKALNLDVRTGNDGKMLVTGRSRSGGVAPIPIKTRNALRDALLGKPVAQPKKRTTTGNLRNDLNLLYPGLYGEVERGGDGEVTGKFDIGAIAEELRDEYGYTQIGNYGDTKAAGDALIDLVRQGDAVNEDRMLAEKADADERARRDGIRRQATRFNVKVVGRKISAVESDLLALREKRHRRAVDLLADRSARVYDAVLADAYAQLGDDAVSGSLETLATRYQDANALEFNKAAIAHFRRLLNEAQSRNAEDAGRIATRREGEGIESGGRETGTGTDQAARPEFGLEGQTEAELAAKAGRENDPALADKDTADAQREAFALSRPAGSAAPKAVPSQQTGLFTADGSASQAAKQTPSDEVAKAKEVLDAAGVKGRERTATIAEVRRGDLTAEDVAEAHPVEKVGTDETADEALDDAETTEEISAVVADHPAAKGVALESRAPSLADQAKKYFGTTRDPREAGYVLPDGTMLDLSGRHYSTDHPSLRGQRSVDHRELMGENKNGVSLDAMFDPDGKGISGSEAMMKFMSETGAMRVDYNSGIASIFGQPTDAQFKWVTQSFSGRYAAFTVIDPVNGRIVLDADWDNLRPLDLRKFLASAAEKGAGTGPLFSRGTASTITNRTPAEVRAELAKAFGNPVIANLERKGLLKIVANAASLPDGVTASRVATALYDGQTAYLIADRSQPGESTLAILHEIGEHHGLEGMLGEKGYAALKNRVATMNKLGNKRIREAYTFVKSAYIRLNPRTGKPVLDSEGNTIPEYAEGSNEFFHEVLANIGQDADIQAKPWWKEMLATVKRWLVQLGYGGLIRTSDIQDMVLYSLKAAALEDRVAVGESQVPVLASKGGLGMEGDSFASRVLNLLSRFDDLFQQATPEGNTVKEIAEEIDPGFRVEPAGKSMAKLHKADGAWEVFVPSSDVRSGIIFQKGDEVWINVARLIPGKDIGNRIYGIAAGYAHNTGRVLVGDPNGLSKQAFFRRTENMLSSALKFGTTKHLEPHEAQVSPSSYPEYENWDYATEARPINWKPGNDAHNLRELIYTSYKSAIDHVPALKEMSYDFDRGEFIGADGRAASDKDFERIAGDAALSAPGSRYRAGSATAKRAVVIHTLLREKGSGERGRILEAVGRQLSGGLDERLTDILYSKAEVGSDKTAYKPVDTESAEFKSEDNPSILESRAEQEPSGVSTAGQGERILGDSGRRYSAQQKELFRNVGRTQDKQSTLDGIMQWANKRWIQGMFDQFRPIKELDQKAYVLTRLSKGATGAFEAFMHHGKLSLVDGAYDADTSGGVVENVFVPIGKETTDFLYWIAGNRAERLMSEGKERLFTDADIAAAKSLADGVTDFDYTLPDGKVTRDRTLIYRDSLRKFNQFNKNVMDMAEQSGLIDGASRHMWEHEFYVPFYRLMENEDGGVRGMNIKKGIIRQQAFHKLKGGKEGLNDLLANTLMNWAHLIDAAAKNRAAKATIKSAEKMGIARPAVEGEKNTVWYSDAGRKVQYAVEDQGLLEALGALDYVGLRGPMWDALTKPKHWLTIGVTASPFFKVRNLIRDSVQAIAASELGYNPVANVIEGYKLTDRESQDYVSALAGGGLIRFGTMLEGNDASRARHLIRIGSKDAHMLDNVSKLRAFWEKHIEPAVDAYNEIGNRGEEINRMSLYKQLRKKGRSHAEASLEARDLMDFSLQGSFATIRVLSQVVPFFNARMQGMYKLGRASKEHRAHMATVIGAASLVSLALLAAYSDDDDWKEREEWDRDNYWWFKFGGIAYRIPKPFEVGAVATLAERVAELAFSAEMTGDRFRRVVTKLLKDQLAMNPVPQAVKPIVDLYANRDSFTERPIESMSMQGRDPEYRYNANTTMPARAASSAIGGALSPVQVDHLVRAYFGWLGATAIVTADIIARLASDEPTKPALDWYKFSSGGMVSEVDSAGSRYVSWVYDQAKEVEQAYRTYNDLRKTGKTREAKEYKDDNRDTLNKYRRVEDVKKQLAAINERIRQVERSDKDPEKKKAQIGYLRRQQNTIAKRLAPGLN